MAFSFPFRFNACCLFTKKWRGFWTTSYSILDSFDKRRDQGRQECHSVYRLYFEITASGLFISLLFLVFLFQDVVISSIFPLILSCSTWHCKWCAPGRLWMTKKLTVKRVGFMNVEARGAVKWHQNLYNILKALNASVVQFGEKIVRKYARAGPWFQLVISMNCRVAGLTDLGVSSL